MASVGSTRSEPNELVGRPAETDSQSGWAARALPVRQMPPPAAATHTRQVAGTGAHVGSIASAVTRPDVVVARPV